MKILLSCEHGGNEIPQSFKYLFKGAGEILKTHRGYDPGTLDLFEQLKELSDYNKASTVSRLFIELNRSLHHSQLFSEFTCDLPPAEKVEIIDSYYLPYRNKIKRCISEIISQGDKVLHISVHSFTPVLKGEVRTTDIGLLYDPSRREEKYIAKNLKKLILNQQPKIKVRFNYPYLGKADGLTTWLRKVFPQNYAGIELEVNQKFSTVNKMEEKVTKILYKSILELKEITSHNKLNINYLN